MSVQLDMEDIVGHKVFLNRRVKKCILNANDFVLDRSWAQDFIALGSDPADISLR
jgi:hypothetical protein